VKREIEPILKLYGALTWALLLIINGAGCATLQEVGEDENISYLETALQNFEAAQEAFDKERYEIAIQYFEHVKNNFPYSKYSALADLGIANTHFALKEWQIAADHYRFFIRFHPRHPEVPLATYKIAAAYSSAIPEKWPILPGPHERDPDAAEKSIRAWNNFLGRYPDHELAEEGKSLRLKARVLLAQYNFEIGQFYEDRHHWQGAAWRYERVAKEFRDTEWAPKSLFAAGRLYAENLDDAEQAASLYQKLIAEHGASPWAERAKDSLANFQKDPPPAP